MPTIIRDKKIENRGRKVKDIKDERFGHLVAIEETPERFNGKVIWRCRCDCGNVIKITSHRLLHTEISNCFDENCPYRDTTRKVLKEEDFSGETRRCASAMEDITGQVFGVPGLYVKRQIKAFERDLIRGIKTDCGSAHHRPGMPRIAQKSAAKS